MLITATRIHNGKQWLPEGSVINIADDGTIIEVLDSSHTANAVHHKGIICPGFVNAHCHLELSHMKGAIAERTGLIPFLQQVAFNRNNHTEEQKIAARHKAFNDMLANGIVAVGDIANTNDTLDLRSTGKMHFYTFVEAIGFSPTPQRQFDYAVNTYRNFEAQPAEGKKLNQSIVPHAPYSVSKQLFELISNFNHNAVLSVHNQETRDENDYYINKSGAVNDLLQTIGIDASFFQPSGKPSLQTYLHWLSYQHPTLLIHNTFTTKEDVLAAQVHNPNITCCLCPNANLYIENTLPDIRMLAKEGNNICIGTDSLSSNHQLSIIAELATIKKHYPETDWEDLLRWATYNGAKALQMDDMIGTIEPWKKPGLVLLTDIEATPQVRVL